MSDKISDPANYRKLSEPFESPDAADAAIQAFWKEFYELRNKHRIADATVVVRTIYATNDGDEAVGLLAMHAGSWIHQESMSAFAYGQAVSDRQQQIGKMLDSSGYIKQPKRRK